MIKRGTYAKPNAATSPANRVLNSAIEVSHSVPIISSTEAPSVVDAVVQRELEAPLLSPGSTSAGEESVQLRPLESGMVARDVATMKALRLGPFSVTRDPDLGNKGICIFADADPEVGTEGQEKVQGAVIRLVSASGDALLIVIAKEAAPQKDPGAADQVAMTQPVVDVASDAQQTASDMNRDALQGEIK